MRVDALEEAVIHIGTELQGRAREAAGTENGDPQDSPQPRKTWLVSSCVLGRILTAAASQDNDLSSSCAFLFPILFLGRHSSSAQVVSGDPCSAHPLPSSTGVCAVVVSRLWGCTSRPDVPDTRGSSDNAKAENEHSGQVPTCDVGHLTSQPQFPRL